jgi:hypothetical protein
MTQTTIAKHIPAEGYTATAGDVEIRAMYVNGAGYKVMARKDGALIASQLHTFETDALAAIAKLVAEYTQAQAEPAPVKLAPAAKGTQTKVTDPQHTALALASVTGHIERGGKPGQAPVTVLKALAKRGYLTLTYSPTSRFTVTGADITSPGRVRLAELTAADRELADYTARLQATLTFDQPTNTAPVAA